MRNKVNIKKIQGKSSIVKDDNKPIGLINVDCNCYMNSVIQCLFHLNEFRNYFIINDFSEEEYPISFELKNIMMKLINKNEGKSFALTKFKELMSDIDDCFEGSNGADASDLLRYIFSSISSEQTKCGPDISKMSSITIDTNNENKCFSECQERVGENTALIYITNYIRTVNKCLYKRENKLKYAFNGHKPFYEFDNQSIIDINFKEYHNINDFFSNMSNINKTIEFCPECKNEVDCHSVKSLYMTSNYLIINIDYGKNMKINKSFDYDYNLYVKVSNSNSLNSFKLLCIVFHIGESSLSGHYFACCRNGNQFFKLDDTKVVPISLNDIKNKKEYKPYILFYEKSY